MEKALGQETSNAKVQKWEKAWMASMAEGTDVAGQLSSACFSSLISQTTDPHVGTLNPRHAQLPHSFFNAPYLLILHLLPPDDPTPGD